MANHNDAHAGAVAGLAAGILIIALTVMALVAFQPQHATSLRSSSADGGAPAAAVLSID